MDTLTTSDPASVAAPGALAELRAAVLEGLEAGRSVDQLSDSIMMERYKGWGAYDRWRELNIQGMARHLKATGAVN